MADQACGVPQDIVPSAHGPGERRRFISRFWMLICRGHPSDGKQRGAEVMLAGLQAGPRNLFYCVFPQRSRISREAKQGSQFTNGLKLDRRSPSVNQQDVDPLPGDHYAQLATDEWSFQHHS